MQWMCACYEEHWGSLSGTLPMSSFYPCPVCLNVVIYDIIEMLLLVLYEIPYGVGADMGLPGSPSNGYSDRQQPCWDYNDHCGVQEDPEGCLISG